MFNIKVISGCQTGADEAGLRAAHSLGIKTGGTMLKGYKTENGPRPDLAELFNLKESNSDKYPPRTLKNVKDSDVTVLFGNMESSGCKLTIKYCEENNKPYHIVSYYGNLFTENDSYNLQKLVYDVYNFLMLYKPKIINIAGNRKESNKNIDSFTYFISCEAFRLYKKEVENMTDSLFEEDEHE